MTRLGAASVAAAASALTPAGAFIVTSTTEVATIVGDAFCGDVYGPEKREKGTAGWIS